VNAEAVWYNWDGVNVTYTVPVDVDFSLGTHTLTAWVNDSFGVEYNDSVIFSKRRPASSSGGGGGSSSPIPLVEVVIDLPSTEETQQQQEILPIIPILEPVVEPEPEVPVEEEAPKQQKGIVLKIAGMQDSLISFENLEESHLKDIDVELNINKGRFTIFADFVDSLEEIQAQGEQYVMNVDEHYTEGATYELIIYVYYKGEIIEEKVIYLNS